MSLVLIILGALVLPMLPVPVNYCPVGPAINQ